MKPAENKIRDDLTVLRDRCFFYLRKTSEYPSSDIEEHDLSFELASAGTIYSIDKYDRALRCLDLRERENEDIEFEWEELLGEHEDYENPPTTKNDEEKPDIPIAFQESFSDLYLQQLQDSNATQQELIILLLVPAL